MRPINGTVWNGNQAGSRLTVPAGALYVGIDSPLGPLYLGYGFANADNHAVYLFVGRP
jgi:NTE family protein